MELTDFVLSHLPPPPARVLEVGCGDGELARAVSRRGHDVTAIDPQAPPGPIFHRVMLEELDDPADFHAVVASRSLHHVADLPLAVEKIARLLRPSGVLILDEHAHERFDEATARWYLARLGQPGQSVARCLRDWEADHAGLHGHAAMRSELDSRFAERFFAWRPYLYRELGQPGAEADERRLIEAGEIRATGFRYVGSPRGSR